jgi:hypothetical protein
MPKVGSEAAREDLLTLLHCNSSVRRRMSPIGQRVLFLTRGRCADNAAGIHSSWRHSLLKASQRDKPPVMRSPSGDRPRARSRLITERPVHDSGGRCVVHAASECLGSRGPPSEDAGIALAGTPCPGCGTSRTIDLGHHRPPPTGLGC